MAVTARIHRLGLNLRPGLGPNLSVRLSCRVALGLELDRKGRFNLDSRCKRGERSRLITPAAKCPEVKPKLPSRSITPATRCRRPGLRPRPRRSRRITPAIKCPLSNLKASRLLTQAMRCPEWKLAAWIIR